MLKNHFKSHVVCMLFFTFFPAAAIAENVKRVSGWVEKITLGTPPIFLNAKIDTGARHSSLHAQEYRIFDKGGREWVSFAIANDEGDKKSFEEPIVRYAKIKQKDNQPSRQRPVVMLGICMGNLYKEVEVNLVNRSNFDYPILIGRSFFQGSFVVDADYKYLNEPSCKN